MKRFLCFLALAVVFSTAANAIADRYQDKRLKFKKDWTEYSRAEEKDLPKTQERILERIMDKAVSEDACLDLCYAFDEYVSLSGYDREELSDRLDYIYGVIEGLPSVQMKCLMYLSVRQDAPQRATDSLASCLERNKDALIGKHRITAGMASAVDGSIDEAFHYIDDYEFLLKKLIYTYWPGMSRVPTGYIDELVEYCSGAGEEYMINLVDALMIKAEHEAENAYAGAGNGELIRRYREIADSCGDNAAWIIPVSRMAELLRIRSGSEAEFLSLDSMSRQAIAWADEKLSQKDIPFYEKQLLEDRKEDIGHVIDMLNEKAIYDLTEYFPYPCETEIVFAVKNCSDVHVTINKSDLSGIVMDETVHCPGTRSFGVEDTLVLFTLPALEDGNYNISYYIPGENAALWNRISRRLDVSSYSVAMRTGSDGIPEFYLTDARTGKPVESSGFTIEFEDKGREPFSSVMDFDGFTKLPVEIDCYARLRFVSPDGRRSPEVPIYPERPHYSGSRPYDASYGEFFLDRKLFRPGEKVRFKYVAYHSDGRRLGVEPGKTVSVGLYASDGRLVDSLSCTTGDFGSASGEFEIPEGLMNGTFSIRTKSGSMEYFRVEDAEPPVFSAGFNPVEGIFRYGDSLSVSGYVKSYRGYDVEGAKVAYTVEDRWGGREFSGKTYTGRDGSFSIPVVMTGGYMCINAVATMQDGSSLEFRKSLMTDEYGVGLSILTDCLKVSDDGGFYSIGDDSLAFELEAKNRDGVVLDSLACRYSVCRVGEDGKRRVVFSADAFTGEKLVVGKEMLSPGEYEVSFSYESDGLVNSEARSFIFLEDSEAAYPDIDRPYVFVEVSGDTCLMGGRDSLWVLAEYFDLNTGELLEVGRDVLVPGIHRICDSIPELYPGRSLVRSLYVVKEGEAKVLRTELSSTADFSIDMEVASLRKVTSSGTTEYFTLIFPGTDDVEVLVDIFDKSSEDIMPNKYYFAPQNVLKRAYVPYPYSYFGGSGHFRDFAMSSGNVVMKADAAVAERAMGSASDERALYIPDDILRKDFSSTLAFYPHLRPDADGRIEVCYGTSARLSTFVVQILAHDKALRTAFARDEVVVKRELMVSASVPDFLRVGDSAVLALAVKNDMDAPAYGRFVVEMYDASREDSLAVPAYRWQSAPVFVDAGGTVSENAVLPVADGKISRYALRFAFVGENDTKVSDAEEHVLSVVPSDIVAVNTVSAISDESGMAAVDVRELSDTGGSPIYRIDVSTPVSAAIDAMPLVLEPSVNSLTDWVDALVTMKVAERLLAEKPGMADYVRALEPEDVAGYENTPWYDYMAEQNAGLAALDSLLLPSWRQRFSEEAIYRICGFRYSNGAFSWFPGGKPSAYMTLMLLERYAVCSAFGIGYSEEEAECISGALAYLDGEFSSRMKHVSDSLGWREYSSELFDRDGFVHDYMFVRSFYRNSVPLSGTAGRFYDKCEKLMARRAARADVPLKIKFAHVLLNGDRYSGGRRMADIVASLYEHASADRWGNLCFAPGRHGLYGIFDSEVYINSSALMLFDELEARGINDRRGSAGKVSSLADGTERHLLSLKEGTDWGDGIRTAVAVSALISRSSGEFPEKASSVVADASGLDSLAGDDGILRIAASDAGNLMIVSVSKIYRTAIEDLGSSGNGISVRREFYRRPLASSSLEPLTEGSHIEKGDVIVCRYVIDNDQARSFVRLSAMKPACFAATDIRSGYAYSWRTSFPAYRDIQESHTDYYVDYLPEGVSELTEEFFVTVSGTFSAGNVEIVSLYAPQYRGCTEAQEVHVQ